MAKKLKKTLQEKVACYAIGIIIRQGGDSPYTPQRLSATLHGANTISYNMPENKKYSHNMEHYPLFGDFHNKRTN